MFVPAYNAGKHLEWVIHRIPESMWEAIVSVWIINDGSTDNTKDVAERLSSTNEKIHLFSFDQNRGYGAVVKKGLTLCREDTCDIAVCLHGDGQYPPEAMPGFVEAMQTKRYDILQGSRIASHTAIKGGMPLYKYVAGRILTFFENLVFGLNMTDYHSGYLYYSRRALDTLPFETLSGSFDFDLEVIASARARGYAIGELSIPTHYGDEISHLNPVGYGLHVVRVMIKYLLGRFCP